MIVNRSHFPARAGFSAVSKMNAQLQQLQVKLATGQKYSTLAEMGGTRSSSLSLNARLDRVSAYQSNIDTVSTRLSFLDNAMTRLDRIQSTARTSVAVGGYGTNNINLQTAPTFAFAQLDEVLTLLNTEADGRYVMGGDVTDRPPVQTISAILDGANGRDGFRTIVERFRRDGDALRLWVEDDAGVQEDRQGGQGFGIGLANTRARLQTLYGDRARLDLIVAQPLKRAGFLNRRGDTRFLFSLTTRLLPWSKP